ncbi:MAG: hypothetical protein IPM98_20735 [Lewinellaceae bacterium]|nr:hypothetical protein [Lewinellaceae bacterium]
MTNLVASNGTIVSYREMWVLDGANGENGRQYLKHEIFQDGNSQSGPNYYAIFLSTPTVDYSWKNGKLVEEKFINSQNQTVQQNLYEYEFNETAGKVSLKAMLARKIFEPYCPNSFMFTCDGVNNEPEEYNIVYDMCGLPEHMCNIAYTWYSPCYNQPAGTVINNSTYALNPYAIEWYDVISQFVYLKKKIERTYDPNGSANYVETVTDYQYDLPSLRHHMPVKSIVTNSDGAQYATRTVYPPEYNTSTVSGTTATAIRDLKDNYIINAPVEIVQTLKKSGQTEKVTGAQLIKHKNFSGTRILPNELWQLGTTSALSDFIWSTISGDGTFGNDSRYYQTRVLGNYDTNGNLLEWHKTDDQVSSFLYWNGTAAAVAYARNAFPSEIAYTGFESPGQMSAAHNGNWTISGTNTAADWNTATGYYHTGKTGYKVGTAHSITRSGLPSGNYVVSFFYRDGQVKVNGTTIGAAATSNWQYAETTVNIPGGTATITGAVSAAYIDELRLHPADALMRTIAPDNNSLLPLSMSDENSVPTHYEYDKSLRLQVIRDQDRNIVQTYEYNYQQAGAALNDIKARTVLTSGQTTVAQVNVLTGANVRRIFQYMDGLGRPIQANEIGQSQAQNDIVTPQIYDAFGREAKKYLPYTYTTNSGAYRSTALSEQNTFINGFGAGGYGFSEQSFEASPLNRVVEQSAPGAAWRTGQATRKFVYRTNTSGDAVRDLSNAGTLFAANTLNVLEETDENNRKKITFTDKLGRTVLVKQQVVETPANPPGNYDYTLTYTAYDDFGRPVAVIPPEATKKMITLNNWNHFFTGYSAMTYRYTYDSRGAWSPSRFRQAVPLLFGMTGSIGPY